MKTNITTTDRKVLTIGQDAFNPDLVNLQFDNKECTVLLTDLESCVSTIARIRKFTQ